MTTIFIDIKNNNVIIEPFEKCSDEFCKFIRNSEHFKWQKREKFVRGQKIRKMYIIADYNSKEDFIQIFKTLNIFLPNGYAFNAHDYYEGYLLAEKWLGNIW